MYIYIYRYTNVLYAFQVFRRRIRVSTVTSCEVSLAMSSNMPFARDISTATRSMYMIPFLSGQDKSLRGTMGVPRKGV